MQRKIEKAVMVLSMVGILYVSASFLDVNANNLDDEEYAEWNFFRLFEKDEIPSDGGVDYEGTPFAGVCREIPLEKFEKVVEAEEITVVQAEEEIDYDIAYRLAQLMYAENGSSEDEAILLTGIVALKRVKSNEYPDSLEEVISDDGQYLCYENGSIDCEPDERCLEIAEEILRFSMDEDYPDNLVFQAEFAQGSEVFRHIGNQYFCIK